MARRRGASAQMNLDSLLDTLTNVVGFLVILMALLSLNVADAVKRIKQIDPTVAGVTEGMLREIRQKSEADRQSVQDLQSTWQSTRAAAEQNRKRLDELRKKLAELLKQVPAAPKTPPPDPEALRKKQQEIDELRKQLEQALKESERLKAMLDTTPETAAPPAKIISLPNPREAPKDAKPLVFMCRDGRVMHYDDADLKKVLETNIRRLDARWKPGGEIDCGKAIDFFNARPIGDENFRIRFEVRKGIPHLAVDRRSTGGEEAQRIAQPASDFQRLLRLARARKQYVRYLVFADSYEAYLAARRISDDLGLPAGWEPWDKNYQPRIWVGNICKCGDAANKPPPPPPKPATPPPPPPTAHDPPKPPPPMDQID